MAKAKSDGLEKFVRSLIEQPWNLTLQQWELCKDVPAEIKSVEVIRARPEEGWLEVRISVKVQSLDAVALYNLAMFMTRLEQGHNHSLKVSEVFYDNVVTIHGRLQVPAARRAEFEKVVNANRIVLSVDPSRLWIANDPEENEVLLVHVGSLTGKRENVTVRLGLPEGVFAALRTGNGFEEGFEEGRAEEKGKFSGEKDFVVRLIDDVNKVTLPFVVWHNREQPAGGELTATILETGKRVAIPVWMGL